MRPSVARLAKFTPKTSGETARRSAAGSTLTVTSAGNAAAAGQQQRREESRRAGIHSGTLVPFRAPGQWPGSRPSGSPTRTSR